LTRFQSDLAELEKSKLTNAVVENIKQIITTLN